MFIFAFQVLIRKRWLWDPNWVFGKTDDLGFLSVKKVKTKFLAKWRNENCRFLQVFHILRLKNEDQLKAWILSEKIVFLSAKIIKLAMTG